MSDKCKKAISLSFESLTALDPVQSQTKSLPRYGALHVFCFLTHTKRLREDKGVGAVRSVFQSYSLRFFLILPPFSPRDCQTPSLLFFNIRFHKG